MKTMRKASPLLLLLGLAVAHACGGPALPAAPVDYKYHYIVKPTEMTPEDKKHSKVPRWVEATEKYDAKLVEVEDLEEKAEEARKELAKLVKQFTDGGNAGHLAQLKTDWDTLEADKTASNDLDAENQKQFDADKDGDKADWTKKHDAEVDRLTKLVEAHKQKTAEAKKEYEKWQGYKKAYDDNYENLKPEEKNWQATKKEDVDKLQKWAKDRHRLVQAVTDAEAKVTKANGADRYYKEDAQGNREKDDQKNDIPVTPEDGGADYWLSEMNKAQPQPLEIEDRPSDFTKTGQFEVLGFYGDVHGTEFLLGSDQELDEVKKLFAYTVPKSGGNPEEKKVFAEVTEVKDDEKAKKVASVTSTSYLKINNGVKAVKNHLAMINRVRVAIEQIKGVKRDQKDDQGALIKTGAKKDENKQEDVLRFYLNIQSLDANVYPDRTDVELFRASKDYDVIGDVTDVSGAKPITQGSSGDDAKGEDGGSNTWMIVAIIFIVIVVLGGLGLGYQAYNASGSLQNTDI